MVQPTKSVRKGAKATAQPAKETVQAVKMKVPPAKPTTESTRPMAQPAKPTVQPEKTQPAKPVSQPVKPITQSTRPMVQPVKPMTQPEKSKVQPAKPTNQSARPMVQPVRPMVQPEKTQPAKPITQSTRPMVQPVKPMTQPEKSMVQPAKSARPTVQPIKPMVQPTKPIPQDPKSNPAPTSQSAPTKSSEVDAKPPTKYLLDQKAIQQAEQQKKQKPPKQERKGKLVPPKPRIKVAVPTGPNASTFHMTRGVIPHPKPSIPEKWGLKGLGNIMFRLVYGQKREAIPLKKNELIQMPEEYTNQPRRLEDEEYYHGVLMDSEVEKMFGNSTDEGKFLVRKAQTYCGLRYVLNVQGEHEMYNVLINMTKQRKLYWIDKHAFKTLQQLIEFYVDSKTAFEIFNPETEKKQKLMITTPLKRFSWQINHEQVELENMLGSGQFGEVYKGYLELSFNQGRRLVAVKMVKGENLSAQQMYDLMKEADTMKQLRHPHIVKFYGIATSRHPFMVALEFCNNGPLDNKLRETNTTDNQKVRFLYQAALGMEYLHDVGIIHGDLAARNCLLTKKNSIKISDFGLSNAEGTKLKEGLLPQRYMAPEALDLMIQTKESDVWAFSVLVFEVFHRAFGPFNEYGPDNLVMGHVRNDELKMYLFRRPKKENLPPNIQLDEAYWYQTLDKPKNPMILKRMEILFDRLRYRNVKYRPKFSLKTKDSVVGELSKIMDDYEIENVL